MQRVHLLSRGETITGIKNDRVMTKTFAEGANAVGSLGFVGFTLHTCKWTRSLNVAWGPWSASQVGEMQIENRLFKSASFHART